MGRYVGLDGYRKGWVAAWLDTGGHCGYEIFAAAERLLDFPHAMAMIDIPIGLPQSGKRVCDMAARKMLGTEWYRVFTGARRPLLDFKTRREASEFFQKIGDDGVSCQTFCIMPKMKEVDALMTSARQETIRETHPELVFCRLNGGPPLASKKTDEGRDARCRLLEKTGFPAIGQWIGELRGTGAKPDDLIDACAAALAAANPNNRVPDGEPPRDARGLRMEIWY